jgi:hypothetical protein
MAHIWIIPLLHRRVQPSWAALAQFCIKHTLQGPPEWRSGLRHCIEVLAVPLEILVQVQALSQPDVTGRPMVRRTIGPALSGLGHVLVPLRTSDSCGRPGAVHTDSQYSVSSDTLAGLCFGGRTAFDLRLSRVRTATGQD